MIRKRAKSGAEINVASMSDINFLLLIFFLVSTMFAVEKGLPMALPGESSKQVKLKQEDVLHVEAYSNGSIVIRGHGPVSLGQIKSVAEQKLRLNPEMVIVIETAPEADYGLMINILDELRLAKTKKISLRTLKTSS